MQGARCTIGLTGSRAVQAVFYAVSRLPQYVIQNGPQWASEA